MIRRFIICFFPFALFFIELFFRKGLSWDTEAFLGPSLASIGLGIVVSALELKRPDLKITDQYARDLAAQGFEVLKTRDRRISDFALLFTFLGIPIWSYALYLSSLHPIQYWLTQPAALFPGIFNVVFGIALYIAKELP